MELLNAVFKNAEEVLTAIGVKDEETSKNFAEYAKENFDLGLNSGNLEEELMALASDSPDELEWLVTDFAEYNDLSAELKIFLASKKDEYIFAPVAKLGKGGTIVKVVSKAAFDKMEDGAIDAALLNALEKNGFMEAGGNSFSIIKEYDDAAEILETIGIEYSKAMEDQQDVIIADYDAPVEKKKAEEEDEEEKEAPERELEPDDVGDFFGIKFVTIAPEKEEEEKEEEEDDLSF